MGRDPEATFRDYLRTLPDAQLEIVAEDYVWLADFLFEPHPPATDFAERRECCREECARRGLPELYQMAEDEVGVHGSHYAA